MSALVDIADSVVDRIAARGLSISSVVERSLVPIIDRDTKAPLVIVVPVSQREEPFSRSQQKRTYEIDINVIVPLASIADAEIEMLVQVMLEEMTDIFRNWQVPSRAARCVAVETLNIAPAGFMPDQLREQHRFVGIMRLSLEAYQ